MAFQRASFTSKVTELRSTLRSEQEENDEGWNMGRGKKKKVGKSTGDMKNGVPKHVEGKKMWKENENDG